MKTPYGQTACKDRILRFPNLFLAVGLVALFAASQKANSTQEKFPINLFAQAKPEDYIGSKACEECHSDEYANFRLSAHSSYSQDPHLPLDKQGCEGCHGPGKFHLDESNPRVIAYGEIKPKEVASACLRCHQSTMQSHQWSRTAHAQADVSCVSCHRIHPITDEKKPHSSFRPYPYPQHDKRLLKGDEATMCSSCHRAEVSEFRLNTHHPVPEARMVCTDCHEIHPTDSASKRINLVKDKCVRCHGDIAGPFVYEHDPVAGWSGEGCAECHKPHGSPNPRLLKGFSRGLCAQCHTDKLTNHYPGNTCWTANCHVAIHGSNSDPRFLSR